MENSELIYDVKIKKLLKKFLKTDFKIKNDVYLNSLLSFLSGNAETGCKLSNCSSISCGIFMEWIMEALSLWEMAHVIPDSKILAFALNLTSFLSKEESIFVAFNRNDVFERLIKACKPGDLKASPTVKLAYIKLLTAFLEHKSGTQWTIASNYWNDILKFSLSNQTVYITKDGHAYLARLLCKVKCYNESFCNFVVETIMEPLSEKVFTNIKSNGKSYEISDEEIHTILKPTLLLVGNILEIYLNDIVTVRDFTILKIFLDNYNLEKSLENYLMIAQSSQFTFDIVKVLFILYFFDIVLKNENTTTFTLETLKGTAGKLCNIFNTNMAKGFVQNVLQLCYLSHIYWKNICGTSENSECSGCFQYQLLCLQFIPVIIISFQLYGSRDLNFLFEKDELRDHFVGKLFKQISQQTLRLGFKWRTYLLSHPNLFEASTIALSYIVKSKVYFTRDLGATMFQGLIYTLRDVVEILREKPEHIPLLVKQVNWAYALMDAIAIYIEEFHLTWRDSVETICVLNISFDYLSFPIWDTRLVVKALKLVDISISKYMSPNLALLIDRTNDSTMAFIGPLLYAKLHDSSWEVRDSALEVLCTICHNANTKFPSFQKIVLDSELPKLVVHMSLNDGEGFVRATAVKCLREMIQVEDFWADLLKTENFHEKMINILQNETEGIVRTQAASLMCAIYAHQTFPNEIMDKVYDIMAHAATGDLHWEAKVKALDFWETVIKTHLCNQGMIDGSFPTVTFSKEHRKIVTLTEVEIRKRLVKVLNQLGQVGCLGVLMTGVQDDCDIEVSKNATRITQNFMELLRNYNIHTMDNLSVPMSPSDVSSPSFSSARSSVDDGNQFSSAQSSPEQVAMVCQAVPNAGSVLDNIVMSKDANLLTSIYSPGNVTTNDVQVTSRQLVTPNQFITFAQQDLEAYLNERKKWLTGIDDIGSLLDDILKDYDDQDVNSMDCY